MKTDKATFASSSVANRVYDLLIRAAVRRMPARDHGVTALGLPGERPKEAATRKR